MHEAERVKHCVGCRFLAGDGAREWAKEQGLPAAPSAEAASQVSSSCNASPSLHFTV